MVAAGARCVFLIMDAFVFSRKEVKLLAKTISFQPGLSMHLTKKVLLFGEHL